MLFQAECDLCSGSSFRDIPSFGFTAGQPDRARVGVFGMNLDRQRLTGVQQFEQKRWFRGRLPRSFILDFANAAAIPTCSTPWAKVNHAPGLVTIRAPANSIVMTHHLLCKVHGGTNEKHLTGQTGQGTRTILADGRRSH